MPNDLNKNIFIIVAIYNEAPVIADVLAPLIERGYTVVAVNDGSSDNTANVLRKMPGIIYLEHLVNLGQGGALATGMRYAISAGANVIVTFDGDGQHDVNDIPQIVVDILENKVDVVLGSRFLNKQATTNMPASRRILLKLALSYTRFVTGLALTDTHNGFRAMNGQAAIKLIPTLNGMAHASEIVAKVARHKLRFSEATTNIAYTEYSLSKGQRAANFLNILWDSFTAYFKN